MAARRKRKGSASEWGWRLSGAVLCAFFGLGVMAGLGVATNHRHAVREAWLRLRRLHLDAELAPAAGAPVAVVERADGLYLLSPGGTLAGPVSSRLAGDLPVLSGPGLQDARAPQLLEYAGMLVRAETTLSELVSEMHVEDDRTAGLFLDRTQTEVLVNLDREPAELSRAAAILRRWRSRQNLIGVLDMTLNGEAVLRLRQPVAAVLQELRRASAPAVHRHGKEIASR